MKRNNQEKMRDKPSTNPAMDSPLPIEGPSAGDDIGRFAYHGLERVIHEKARLSIMTSLAAHRAGLLFNDLKQLCELTDGNLSRHLFHLQQAGLVELWKRFHNHRPQTLCRLSPSGAKRFVEYLAELERVVGDALASAESTTDQREPNITGDGWVLA